MNKTITTLGLVLVVTVPWKLNELDYFGGCERKSNFWKAHLWPVTQLAWMPQDTIRGRIGSVRIQKLVIMKQKLGNKQNDIRDDI